jgi:hypothetical protein
VTVDQEGNMYTAEVEYLAAGGPGEASFELLAPFFASYVVLYQADVPAIDPGLPPTKRGYFLDCVASMTPENQRQFLYDLCDDPPPASGPLPNQAVR